MFLVVIAASSGGVAALLDIASQLPAGFPAPVCMVLHVGAAPSLLPELMSARGKNPAAHALHGERLVPGRIYIAPPDHHMLVDRDAITLTRGPRENHVRPAADPLFRSAAAAWGRLAIGVVLTGNLDDGTAGLQAIKACGGTAIVQDPRFAVAPEMPRSALAAVEVDDCLALEDIPPRLLQLVGSPAGPPQARPPHRPLDIEVAINSGQATMENLAAIATPSTLTCPDCGGSLWEVRDQKPIRFRCHTGHAYGALSLAAAQAEGTEHALRASVRALRERELLVRRLASVAELTGDPGQAAAGREHADHLREQADQLARFSEEMPPS